ncbi:MAG TPA: alpha-ketoglutarate-dependent dioxygenase AlkB [Jatrophihabitantaceae bacterium]|nr:alpha-ketoglutarate-dependent dioxygenase AlkB [Jatrophihabitantaceae bacterium]
MTAPEQQSLFAGADVEIDASFGTVVRYDLDETSWVELVPGWLSGDDRLLGRLVAAVPFEQHQRWMYNQLFDEPRLTAEYPDIGAAPESFVRVIADALSRRYGVTYDGLWLNLYRDERDRTGWHRDWATCKRELCIVPVLSLGATRRFLLKPRAGGSSTALTVTGGDLVVMGGRCQRDWLHSVPKQSRPAGARVSLNFESSWQRG